MPIKISTLSLRQSFHCLFAVTLCLTPFASACASTLATGTLIKGSTPAVYYYTASGTRLVFPNEKTYATWYADFSTVQTISDAQLAAIQLGGNVTYRPGVRLVKIVSDPKVYAVAHGGVLRWVETEAVARALYGNSWAQQVDDISDAFFVNYALGVPISDASTFSPAIEIATARIDASAGTTTSPPPTTTPPTTTPPVTITPGSITFAIDATSPRSPISPYIYGSNTIEQLNGKDREPNLQLYRQGGNRLTTYNWENNASNAGTDWGPNESDGYMSDSATPGLAATQVVDAAHSRGAAELLTIPINDYVAADKNGNVTEKASDSNPRWIRNEATKASALSLTPSTTDHAVYQDEFVNFMTQKYSTDLAAGKNIFYSLDNEPALWPTTHPLLHPGATTYAEMADKTTRFATMIKQEAPSALVFGAVAYGFNEFVNLQNAPDANGRNYLDFLLQTAKQAEAAAGHRVVDVLDLHWYPEATGGGTRVANSNSATPSQAEIDARVQAPRSLWDPAYKETSWISDYLSGPINLIPSVKKQIATNYPGTKLSFSEYFYGGGSHVSGGIAQADVLGIFGREGVFAATLWPIGIDGTSFIYGGFDMFLNYDGAGHRVGNLSLSATTTDNAKTSVYAMTNGSNQELDIVAINKTTKAITVTATIAHGSYTSVNAYQLTSAKATPVKAATPTIQGGLLQATLPALSVTTFVLNP